MGWIKAIWKDGRYAMRVLTRRPGLTAAAILALALGIGANSAIFSVVDGVLLEPLPYPDADRLVTVWENHRERGVVRSEISPVIFAAAQERVASFEDAAGWWYPDLNLTGENAEPERIKAIEVTDNFAAVMGVAPFLGPGIVPEERDLGNREVMLSHRLWQRRYGSDEQLLGENIYLDGVAHQVVGVWPEDFLYPGGTDVWIAMNWNPAGHNPEARFFSGIARLKPGATVPQAQEELDRVAADFAREFPRSNQGWTLEGVSLLEHEVGDVRPALYTLLGAVAFVLLLACANVANLLLAQGAGRSREVAVRSSLGASQGRLLRQFLTESLLLATAGGAVAVLVAVWGLDLLKALAPAEVPRLEEVAIDGRALAFTFSTVVLTAVLFGITPAFQNARFGRGRNLSASLKDAVRNSTGGSSVRGTRGALVVAQVAMALLLVFGAALLIRSFASLVAEDPGFRAAGGATFNIQLPSSTYGSWNQVSTFYDTLTESLAARPEIESAAAGAFLPLEPGWRLDFTLMDQPDVAEGSEPKAQYHPVTAGYFRMMGIPLLEGRVFDGRESPEAPGQVVINRATAERFWPQWRSGGAGPVGQRIQWLARGFGPLGRILTEDLEAEIIGVVENVKNAALTAGAEPAIYFPHTQFAYRSMNVAVRAAAGPAEVEATPLAPLLRQQLQIQDPAVPFSEFRSLDEHLGEALAQPRFTMFLLSTFAGLALLLAVVGAYGVMSHAAGQRLREMGIRLALRAQRRDVVRILVFEGMRLAVLGIALGGGAALLLGGGLRNLLFEVSASDPASLMGAVLLLFLAAALAAYLPARRAARVDPIRTLREE